MRSMLNYEEFYPKPLLPIQEGCSTELQNSVYATQYHACTHWLIALEGSEISPTNAYCYWQVVVYPSTAQGSFKHKYPFYISPYFSSMYKAFQYVRILECLAAQGQLAVFLNKEKIVHTENQEQLDGSI